MLKCNLAIKLAIIIAVNLLLYIWILFQTTFTHTILYASSNRHLISTPVMNQHLKKFFYLIDKVKCSKWLVHIQKFCLYVCSCSPTRANIYFLDHKVRRDISSWNIINFFRAYKICWHFMFCFCCLFYFITARIQNSQSYIQYRGG